ncbi:mechanosensitive ion channel [Flavobacterium sp. GT3R68]|nr:mechanosensitive ion channel [Flavobacterium sp. GSN2]TRW92646.1 mechanosensitive ion channel [Flavobacterium sp. GT3R68]
MEIIEKIRDIFGLSIIKTEDVNFTLGTLIALVTVFIITGFILKMIRKFVTNQIPEEDKGKFVSIFQFIKYIAYIIVIMFTLNASGVNISVLLTASAAIFLGLGFALQQLFQDLISGILIILDQSLHVGDIIEIDGKVCKVERIHLRSTIAVTRDQRVLIIPNHKFLTDILYNWTQNSNVIRESIEVNVAYGSDTEVVKKILLESAKNNKSVLESEEPMVIFEKFGDSSLVFMLYFFFDDAFTVPAIKSELRFEIDAQFRANGITIPFPQRDVHIINPKN